MAASGRDPERNSSLKSLVIGSHLPGRIVEPNEIPEPLSVLLEGLAANQSLTCLSISAPDWMDKFLANALKENFVLRQLIVKRYDKSFSSQPRPRSPLVEQFENNELNLESIEVRSSEVTEETREELNRIGFDRTLQRRREITNLVIAIFNIAQN
jgi:hypothetical protein